MRYSGIDLHSNNCFVLVSDSEDRVIVGYVSNGKKKGEGNRKNGNQYLSWAFVEAAHFALRYSEPAKHYYERKRAKTNVAVATKALAHKLARASFHMLKDGQDFDATRCFALLFPVVYSLF